MLIDKVTAVPPRILTAAQEGNLVVFIGAGVSRLTGYSSWREYADAKAKHLYQKGLISYYTLEKMRTSFDPRKALSICQLFLDESRVEQPNELDFLCPYGETSSTVYESLYRFNAVYVTTNYDECLDRIAERGKIIRQLDNKELTDSIEEEQPSQRVFYSTKDLNIVKLLTPGNVLQVKSV